jgi:hypothetical protein
MGGGMATAPTEVSTIANDSAARPSFWRRIAERPYAPETLLLYSALSFLFLGRNLIGHFSDRYIGMGHDPASGMFFLEWWRYALAHRLNPFDLTAAWYPPGFNLARTTCIPLAAWTMMPLEATLGPVATYNVAILLCPALSAWTAFLLCRYITRSYWPALAGGYIFGFSAYMLGHSLGHLTLTMVFLLPPAVYLVLRKLVDEIPDTQFVALFTLVLLGQFLSSLEVLAAMTLTGATFLALVWLWADAILRARILKFMQCLGASIAILAGLTSPYLYYFFRAGSFSMANGWAYTVAARPLSLFVPVSTNIFGAWDVHTRIVSGVSLWEAGEYVGIPLFLLVWNFARTRWNETAVKPLTVFVGLACVATFGPYLMIGSKHVLPLPWLPFAHLPLLHMVLPARLSVYVFLDLAVVTAMWLAGHKNSFTLRLSMAAAVIASLLPNLSASYWTLPANIPTFFQNGIFRKYLWPGETVLVLPYGYWGDSDLWLAQTHMYFRMAGGWVGVVPSVPPSFDQYPIVSDLYNLVDIPEAAEQLRCFLAQKNITAVIVADVGEHFWRPIPDSQFYVLERTGFTPAEESFVQSLMSGVGARPLRVGGATLYRVSLDKLGAYKRVDPRLLQERVASIRLARLIEAAHEYVAQGFEVKSLTPLRAQELGLLPPFWVGGAYLIGANRLLAIQDELVLGPGKANTIAVGILGSREALRKAAETYSPHADPPQGTFFATRVGNGLLFAPAAARSASISDSGEWALLFEFRPDTLTRAAKFSEQVLLTEKAHPLINIAQP